MECSGGGIDLMMKAMTLLTDEDEIAMFANELSTWLGVYHGDVEKGTGIASEWISTVSGHMNDDVIIDRWQRALPQADVSTGFMPNDKTIRLQGYDPNNPATLSDNLRSAVKFLWKK